MCNEKQNKGHAMNSMSIELCDSEMATLKSLKIDYQAKSDVFLKERGFNDAISKFTHFRLNNQNVEVHVDELGSSGCEARLEDEAFVKDMEESYANIQRLTASIEQKATQSFKAELKRKLAF